MKKNSEKEINPLSGFVRYINSKNNHTIKKADFGIGRPKNPNLKLFDISTVALVLGWMPNTICSLTGYELNVYGKVKQLSMEEMDTLYKFIEQKNSIGAFLYVGSYFDLTIQDGNSHSYFINWNGIKSEGRGGHTMPSGLQELIDYCKKIVNL